jgi:hypothetical protein
VPAPVAHDLLGPDHERLVVGARGVLDQPHGRALDRLIEPQQLEAAGAIEQHAPSLTGARGVDTHGIGLDREHRHEPDPELADLGHVAVLAGREQPRQLRVDDVAVHALAVVGHDHDHRAGVGILAGRLELDVDVDLAAAGVERVLDQLAEERHRIRELVDQIVERVADIDRSGAAHPGPR